MSAVSNKACRAVHNTANCGKPRRFKSYSVEYLLSGCDWIEQISHRC